jgi:hypothetical protein
VSNEDGDPSTVAGLSDTDKARLRWISMLHDLASTVGRGVTDLGASLYPPLQLSEVNSQVERHTAELLMALDCLTDATTMDQETLLELPQELHLRVNKVQRAVLKRRQEAMDAMEQMEAN